jgi:hypothetical protein
MMEVWTQPTTVTVEYGVATYCRDGLMEQVADRRGIPLDGRVPVALNRAGDIGREVWLEWPGGTIDPAIVVDCAERADYFKRLQLHRVVEVSADLAKLRGFYGIGPADVKVWYKQPPRRYIPAPDHRGPHHVLR